MSKQQTPAAFGEDHAAVYDQQAAKLAPLREAMHLMMKSLLAGLPEKARVLCVGAGTGLEMADLAQRFPGWHFTAVEPSAPMLHVCRQRMEKLGMTERCTFHEGYLDSLPAGEKFDAATSLLVSQFILERKERERYFRQIAARLRPGGYLVNADLAGDVEKEQYRQQMDTWLRLMQQEDFSLEKAEKARVAYAKNVAILPPREVEAIMISGGFAPPLRFLQTMLIHGWFTHLQ